MSLAPLLRLFLFLSFAGNAYAYIPPAQTILDRTAATQGNRGYLVVIETRLNGDSENLAFRETWTVKDDQSMKVQIEGISALTKNFRREYVYRDNRRYWLNQNKEVMGIDLGAHHFERYFHFRDGERFRRFLLDHQIIPQTEPPEEESAGTPEAAVKSSAAGSSAEVFPYRPDPYVRLSRWAGKITYAFGIPTEAGSERPLPGLWIEQDVFHLLRVRTPQQDEMTAGDYVDVWGLAFPKHREIKWKSNSVSLTMVSIDKAVIGPKTRKALEPASLKDSDFGIKSDMAETLNTSIMNEFYQRFR